MKSRLSERAETSAFLSGFFGGNRGSGTDQGFYRGRPILSFPMPILPDRGTGAMLIAPAGTIGKKIEITIYSRLLFADNGV
jgi:hypothetical protein